MRRQIKLLVLTAATALAVLSFPGQAAAVETSSCAFTGIANLEPDLPPIGLATTSRVLGTTFGTFYFSATAQCVKADGDPGEESNSTVYEVDFLTSSGHYSNLLCGAWLSLYGDTQYTQLTSSAPGWQGPVSAKYRMDFIGTTSGSGSGDLLIFTGGSAQRGGLQGRGVVTGAAVGNCLAPEGVTEVVVAGSFNMTH